MKKTLFLLLSAWLPLMALAENTAIVPASRTTPTNWVARHEGFLAEAKQGKFDLVFIGDSITDGWRRRGLEVWNKCYAPRHALNLGIGGDRTQHVLWRIEHGELDGLKPKAVVLMIGTNNTGKEKDGSARNSTAEVIEGVTAVVKKIRAKLPESKLLLLAVFPRGAVDAPQRAQIKEINTAIAKLDDGKMIKFLDIGKVFLADDGSIPKTIMPDLLHPSAAGVSALGRCHGTDARRDAEVAGPTLGVCCPNCFTGRARTPCAPRAPRKSSQCGLFATPRRPHNGVCAPPVCTRATRARRPARINGTFQTRLRQRHYPIIPLAR